MVYAKQITNIKVFFVWNYLVFKWRLTFLVCNTIPYHPLSNPKCMPQPQIAIPTLIPLSLDVSIDCGHAPIFPNPNLQYLHRL
jgi:hypothetical protein